VPGTGTVDSGPSLASTQKLLEIEVLRRDGKGKCLTQVAHGTMRDETNEKIDRWGYEACCAVIGSGR
jgi:hypothetical protein